MFNVIKGNIINKNVKVISIPNSRAETKKIDKVNFETLSKNEKSENEFFEPEENIDEVEDKELDFQEIIEEKKKELIRIQEEAVKIITEAEKHAQEIHDKMIADAKLEVNDIKANAWEDGYSRGKNAAEENMQEDVDAILISANRVLTEASIKAREIFQNNQEGIINLSFVIAKKIIKKHVSDKEVLFGNLLEAMKKVQSTKELKIFINWDQLNYSKELKERLKNSFQGIEVIDIIEDRTVEPGGCIIETKLGKIDATIENQLEIVFNALNEE